MDWIAKATQTTRWLGKSWRFFEETQSTQDEAKAWVQSGACHGSLVIADSQRKGRGRFGRYWFSPPANNIYMTVAMQLPQKHPSIGILSLFVGVAVAEALRKQFAIPAMVKWANDVIVDDKKLCGILIEDATSDIGHWALIGIGINVNLAKENLPDELLTTATSLLIATGKTFDRAEVLAAMLCSLERWWEQWASGQLTEFWQTFAQLDCLKGKFAQVRLPDGTILDGIADGVADDGSLRLCLPDSSVQLLYSGEVTVLGLR